MEWKQVQEFEGARDVVVRIQRRGDIHPHYSIQVGRRKKDEPEFLSIHTPVWTDRNGSPPKVDRSLEDLVKQAHDWIEADAKALEDARVAKVQSGELRSDWSERGRKR